ncbi:MAG: 2-oxoglutarate dehydrogenase complex dihydrolipoyllysine-residue succinyltransferase [Gammaproteobacteria bacterium]|nr:2-oxoglutarate dehydrogenase complex dihydrolipoyllysine-residue succinyltransferase [Gammaproteobacteria bacterium]
MSTEIKVPQLPESVADATLVSWHKQEGEAVERDENLVDIETDKVVLEVPAPVSGVLQSISIQDGATVTSGEIIGMLQEGAAKAAAPAETKTEVAQQSAPSSEPAPSADKPLSPSVRRLVEEHSLNPSQIAGTGKDGRLTKADVLAFLDKRRDAPAPEVPEAVPVSGNREERRVPMTRMRARIAERMVESQQTAALLTSFNEVDLTEVMALRKKYKETFEKKHDVRLGFMSFFVKASIEALRRFPVINASIEGDDIVYHDYWDVGVAVSTDKGLVVPVIRDADQMSFGEIERAITDYAVKAREGRIQMEDITGGTFTITNGGVFGSLMSTPIINPPQSAILGMHKIQERPMVVDGEVKARPMMYIALTYDHRIIDGKEAVQFLVTVKESLEDPARLMLQV